MPMNLKHERSVPPRKWTKPLEQPRDEERSSDESILTPDLIADLQAEGWRRGLFYKTLALTGLRLNEAKSLTVGATTLTGPEPFAILQAADEKARRGAEILLRTDLAEDLSRDAADRLGLQQRAAKRGGQPVPIALSTDTPLLAGPGDAIDVLNRDLVAAGLARSVWGKNRKGVACWRIDKRDERGRTFDVHAFRTTFNSLLAAAGVPLTTRRILMRHAAEGITDRHYNDKTLIDLRGALGLLPALPLGADLARQTAIAEGTTGQRVESDPHLFPHPSVREMGGSGANGRDTITPVVALASERKPLQTSKDSDDPRQCAIGGKNVPQRAATSNLQLRRLQGAGPGNTTNNAATRTSKRQAVRRFGRLPVRLPPER